MCGNGGRCIVAFAADLGFRSFDFEAPDGPHSAELISGKARPFSHEARIVRLKMKDVSSAAAYENGPDGEPDLFLDTGTRHAVRFVDNVNDIDVVGEGRVLRYSPDFAPVGANVNFVQVNADGSITVRTYEKGVEDETLACGTGIVASAMATWIVHKDMNRERLYQSLFMHVSLICPFLSVLLTWPVNRLLLRLSAHRMSISPVLPFRGESDYGFIELFLLRVQSPCSFLS